MDPLLKGIADQFAALNDHLMQSESDRQTATSALADAQAQLIQAHLQVGDLQTKLNLATALLAHLRTDIDALNTLAHTA